MLVHRILPCQSRIRPLWKFNPKKHHTLKRLFETTHEHAWRLLFKGNETPPATNSDRGHDINHLANKVYYSYCIPYFLVSRMMSKLLSSSILQDWMERAKRIQCPALLPEEPVTLRLAKMLVPARPIRRRRRRPQGRPRGSGVAPAVKELRT